MLITHRRLRCSAVATALAAVFATLPAAAAEDTAQAELAIREVITQFQQSIVAKDGTRLRSLFLPGSQSWYSVASERELQQRRARKPDAPRFRASDYDSFARSVEQSAEAEEERFRNVRILTDGAVASVHFDFEYLNGGKPTNQGQEAWHLIRTDAGWKIVSLIYSVDKPGS
jgi:hypothetical protein